jgi:hypothetical protein
VTIDILSSTGTKKADFIEGTLAKRRASDFAELTRQEFVNVDVLRFPNEIKTNTFRKLGIPLHTPMRSWRRDICCYVSLQVLNPPL